MTNRIALFIAAAIALGLAIDYLLYDFEGTLFLARKIVSLIDWMAFWR